MVVEEVAPVAAIEIAPMSTPLINISPEAMAPEVEVPEAIVNEAVVTSALALIPVKDVDALIAFAFEMALDET